MGVKETEAFEEISLDDLHRSWGAVLEEGWHVKLTRQICQFVGSLLLHTSILKLKFDGSFDKLSQGGDLGVVIRDHFDNVVRSFSVPVDALDANEAEMFAMLAGCWELLRRGCNLSIIEGDFFYVMQQG